VARRRAAARKAAAVGEEADDNLSVLELDAAPTQRSKRSR
jgi:hypothetical protein